MTVLNLPNGKDFVDLLHWLTGLGRHQRQLHRQDEQAHLLSNLQLARVPDRVLHIVVFEGIHTIEAFRIRFAAEPAVLAFLVIEIEEPDRQVLPPPPDLGLRPPRRSDGPCDC